MSEFKEHRVPGTANGTTGRELERPTTRPTEESVLNWMFVSDVKNLTVPEIEINFGELQGELVGEARNALKRDDTSEKELIWMVNDYIKLCTYVKEAHQRASQTGIPVGKWTEEKMKTFYNNIDILFYQYEEKGRTFFFDVLTGEELKKVIELDFQARKAVGVPLTEDNNEVLIDYKLSRLEKASGTLNHQILLFAVGLQGDNQTRVPELFDQYCPEELEKNKKMVEDIKQKAVNSSYSDRINILEQNVAIYTAIYKRDFDQLKFLATTNNQLVNDALFKLIRTGNTHFKYAVADLKYDLKDSIRCAVSCILVMDVAMDTLHTTDTGKLQTKKMQEFVRSISKAMDPQSTIFLRELRKMYPHIVQKYSAAYSRIVEGPFSIGKK